MLIFLDKTRLCWAFVVRRSKLKSLELAKIIITGYDQQLPRPPNKNESIFFQVGSFNYDMSKMIFVNEFVPDHTESVKSILDYQIKIRDLTPEETHYMALGMNYSVAGFEMILNR